MARLAPLLVAAPQHAPPLRHPSATIRAGNAQGRHQSRECARARGWSVVERLHHRIKGNGECFACGSMCDDHKDAMFASLDAMSLDRNWWIRQTVLCTLAVQNACQMLSMRYSRLPSQPKYLSSTAVVMAEVVKIVLSLVMLYAQLGPNAFNIAWTAVILNWRDTMQVGLPPGVTNEHHKDSGRHPYPSKNYWGHMKSIEV